MKIEDILDETDKENLNELLEVQKDKCYKLPLKLEKSEEKDAEYN